MFYCRRPLDYKWYDYKHAYTTYTKQLTNKQDNNNKAEKVTNTNKTKTKRQEQREREKERERKRERERERENGSRQIFEVRQCFTSSSLSSMVPFYSKNRLQSVFFYVVNGTVLHGILPFNNNNNRKKTNCQKSYLYQAPIIWRNLPENQSDVSHLFPASCLLQKRVYSESK